MTRIKASNPPKKGITQGLSTNKNPNRPGKGRPTPKQGGKSKGGTRRFGGFAGYKGVNVGQAERVIDGQIKREVRGLDQEKKQAEHDAWQQIKAVNNDYARGKGDLDHIFKETGDYIGHQNNEIQGKFNTARTQASAAQAALMAQLQGNAAAVGSGANGELARMGLGDASGQFMGQFSADVANNQDVANIVGANENSNINAMANGARSVGDLLLGMNSGSEAANLGRLGNIRNDAVDQFRADYNRQQNEVNDAIRQARAGRGDMLKELLLQMQQTGWAQYVDNRNLNMQNRQLNLQAQAQRFDQGMARQAASQQRREFGAKVSGGYYTKSNGGSKGGGSSSVGSGGGTVNGPSGGSSGLQTLIDVLSGSGGKKRR